jgi:hypothetical protein
MKIFPIQYSAAFLFFFLSNAAFANVVVVDAALGTGDDEQVQAALDSNPKGTTFLLKGTFWFYGPVWVEKSNTTILGDYIDENRDRRTDAGDTWNTVIDGPFPATFPDNDTFILGGRDFTALPEPLANVTIAGIDFRKYRAVWASNYVIPDGPPACGPEEYPAGSDRILIENNRASGESFESFILLGSNHSTVNNNLFVNESFLADLGFVSDAIAVSGVSQLEGCPPAFLYGKGNAITDNSFPNDLHFATVWQENVRITGNTIIMNHDGSITPNSLAIILRATNGGVVANNYIESTDPDIKFGIAIDSRVPYPGRPFDFTDHLDIRDNTIINVQIPILTLGGLEQSSIRGNTIIGPGVFGIALLDNANGFWGPGQQNHPSSNFTVSNNHIDDQFLAGVLLNGDTSGVSVVNNAFGGPAPLIGDIFLSGGDFLFGEPTCPAHDNEIIATNFATTVVDQYVAGCEGGPNEHLGVFNYLKKDLGDLPTDIQAKLEQLRQLKIDSGLGHPQEP